MKIALFCDTFFPMVDGVVMVVHNSAVELSKICDVTVFVPKGRFSFDDSTLPYKVVRCNKKFPLSFLDYDIPKPEWDKKFLKQLYSNSFDLVHIHSPFNMGKIGLKYAKKMKIPVIATMHSQYKKDFEKAVTKTIAKLLLKKIVKVYNQCNEVLTPNEGTAELCKEYGVNQPISVMRNGVDIGDYAINSIDVKKEYNINADEKIMLFVGRMVSTKDITFSIDVAKYLKDKNFLFKFLFVGSGIDEEKFKSYVKKLNLSDNVIFTGPIYDRNKLAAIYEASNLFVFPSRYDTDGIVKSEAAVFGTPSIFTKGSVAASAIKDNVNGFVEEFNVEKFGDRIIQIFKNDNKYKQVSNTAKTDLVLTWKDAVLKTKLKYEERIKN